MVGSRPATLRAVSGRRHRTEAVDGGYKFTGHKIFGSLSPIVETWDALGMRATRSDDTLLDGAFVPDEYIARVVPAGFAGADRFVLGIFAWAECTFGSIYTGIAERALELAVTSAAQRTAAERSRGVDHGASTPRNSALVHELGGKTMLGGLGEEPRW